MAARMELAIAVIVLAVGLILEHSRPASIRVRSRDDR
jgi:hypothetical protein